MSLTAAILKGDLAELPSRRDEDWRWTNLAGLVRALPPRSERVPGAPPAGPFDAVTYWTDPVVNGDPDPTITGSITYGGGGGEVTIQLVGRGDGSHVTRRHIDVPMGDHLIILESYEGEGAYVSAFDLEVYMGRGSTVERIVLADEPAGAVSVSIADITLNVGCKFFQTVIASGARRQRIETRVAHSGGAEARLDGVYLLSDQRHADITTVVTHAGRDGTTDQLTKGVVTDQGRGVFQGRIVVKPGADKTDARMGHHALVLSDRAEVDAKPELEIFADDVACAHGNTVGALDEEALFYAQQRGVPEAEARAMLTEAFVGEVVDRIQHEGAREIVRAWVAERLRRTR